MSGFAFPPPKAGGLPAFPGLGGKGGPPDFSAFAKPRESAVTAMPVRTIQITVALPYN